MKLGILISGGGTTFINLHEKIAAGELDANIACVISSSSKAAGLEKARYLGYPAFAFGRRKFPDDDAYSEALRSCLQEHNVDLVVLAGFLKRFLPGKAFAYRTLNIHPSLLPSFCGKGFYGMKVHEAVWRRGCKVSGCTVHLVNDEYDAGPIVVQRTTPILGGDSPEDIRRKVFEQECLAFPEAIDLFIRDKVMIEDDRVIIRE